MTCNDLPPGPVQYVLLWWEAAAGRLRGDRGDVSITATVIIAAGLAAAAVLLVAAISAKARAWIANIPG